MMKTIFFQTLLFSESSYVSSKWPRKMKFCRQCLLSKKINIRFTSDYPSLTITLIAVLIFLLRVSNSVVHLAWFVVVVTKTVMRRRLAVSSSRRQVTRLSWRQRLLWEMILWFSATTKRSHEYHVWRVRMTSSLDYYSQDVSLTRVRERETLPHLEVHSCFFSLI